MKGKASEVMVTEVRSRKALSLATIAGNLDMQSQIAI
jgi:hypothetical protein